VSLHVAERTGDFAWIGSGERAGATAAVDYDVAELRTRHASLEDCARLRDVVDGGLRTAAHRPTVA
jgi:hypothetical protein